MVVKNQNQSSIIFSNLYILLKEISFNELNSSHHGTPCISESTMQLTSAYAFK